MSGRPIYDFIIAYTAGGTVRMHMPGHKGSPLLGPEVLDITEIKGADYLFEAEGIIRQSEDLAAEIYGAGRTLFSTEGSSLSIKGMLACVRACLGPDAKIAAGRNCHRAFINGCILLGIDPVWIWPETHSDSICASHITPSDVEAVLKNSSVKAVYITSPDYLGNMADVSRIAEVCHRHGALLLVDNAHGAYLKFAGEGLHPLDCGADICCDSAHKTLPALTGASLLHISRSAPAGLADCAKAEMSLFASTSPSYVIIQSTERSISELSNGLAERIRSFCKEVSSSRERISLAGFTTVGDEPMKITVAPMSAGYTGNDLADELRKRGIEPEYSDSAYTVLMPSPYNKDGDLDKVIKAFEDIPRRYAVKDELPRLIRPERAMGLREAYFSGSERIPVDKAAGRICSRTALSCQPSVPVIAGGEVFDEKIIKILKSYSIFEADVVK
ncbi:MAG: aminotransferase class V-fold PLP-dependent enzyme [Ruminococcus sp.]|nr:aminotransferase class V-fold PLP-dependent enzyme [Ruminococcus sp.]